MFSKYKIIFGIFLASIFLFWQKVAMAQNFGIDPVDNTILLTQGDPRIMAGRVIQIILSLLGILTLGLIIYAGFLWTTSNGEEEKIRSAKNILKNAVIGLVIILSSWAITSFIISRLSDAISGVGTGPSQTTNNPSFGLGAIGACSVESVYPVNGQKDVPRNSSILVTFKEEIDLNSVCIDSGGNSCACDGGACSLINPETIRIFKDSLGDSCGVTCPNAGANTNITEVAAAISSDNKILVMTPLNYLGSADSNTNYTVKITSNLKKVNGSSMFSTCRSNDLIWGFEVSNKLDLTPPQVVSRFLFPRPDNQADVLNTSNEATAATAEIRVNSCPKVYKTAELINVSPDTEVSLNYHGLINKFKVSIPADTPNKAQLFNGNTNALLGIADFNSQDIVTFNGYFSLKAVNRVPGQLWTIDISPEQLADYLTVGNVKYIFATSGENNNILVPAICSASLQAMNIEAKISGHPDVNIIRSDTTLILTAKVAGTAANNFILATSNNSALNLTAFSGGTNAQSNYTINDKKDAAMNSVIRVSFNEAINPITLSGTASEVSNYIKVVNANTNSQAAGGSCSNNSDCRSYSCSNGSCVGNFVNGRFMVSPDYKTVEFISDNECGINGCGEKIYCLPASSNLAVEIKSANLQSCNSDTNCVAFSPFNRCFSTSLGYNVCQNSDQHNYPLANILNLDGVVDLAFNSLDGNRDSLADGPISFFNENLGNETQKDNYRFSFFVSDRQEISAPRISSIMPDNDQSGLSSLIDPVEITFNTLMMHSTLRSGSITLPSGTETTNHKFINLRTSDISPLGYWMSSSDKDFMPLDGVPDITVTQVSHTPFLESVSYSAQVGSGVKDIYQNCFKPSSGPNCEANQENPSCCFGINTSELDENGNCN